MEAVGFLNTFSGFFKLSILVEVVDFIYFMTTYRQGSGWLPILDLIEFARTTQRERQIKRIVVSQ